MHVAKLLQDTSDALEKKNTILRRCGKAAWEFCSYQSWKTWMGCSDQPDQAPHLPYAWTLFHTAIATLSYPMLLTPLYNTSQGLMWDYSGFHLWNVMVVTILWFSLYQMKRTSPGFVGGPMKTPDAVTRKYRRLYDEIVADLGNDEEDSNNKKKKMASQFTLCHTCHIARPLRSKHCRIAKR